FIFFFSSRRRHTRSKRDWSSDVCSSDLQPFLIRDRKPLPCRSLQEWRCATFYQIVCNFSGGLGINFSLVGERGYHWDYNALYFLFFFHVIKSNLLLILPYSFASPLHALYQSSCPPSPRRNSRFNNLASYQNRTLSVEKITEPLLEKRGLGRLTIEAKKQLRKSFRHPPGLVSVHYFSTGDQLKLLILPLSLLHF